MFADHGDLYRCTTSSRRLRRWLGRGLGRWGGRGSALRDRISGTRARRSRRGDARFSGGRSRRSRFRARRGRGSSAAAGEHHCDEHCSVRRRHRRDVSRLAAEQKAPPCERTAMAQRFRGSASSATATSDELLDPHGSGAASIPRSVEHLAHLTQQGFGPDGLLEKRNAGVECAVMNDRFVRVARHEQDLHRGTERRHSIG